jgi:hypothetical protein
VYLAGTAAAQTSRCQDPAAVRVTLRVVSDLVLESDVARQLEAGFSGADVAVCVDAGSAVKPGDPVAQVEVTTDRASLRVRIRDGITRKTLERELQFGALPPDSRAVALALFVEELLHASWSELALKGRIERTGTSPRVAAAVRREVDELLQPAAAVPRVQISLGAAAAHFSSGLTQLGPELWLGLRLLPWLETSLRTGYRVGPSEQAAHGSISAQAVLAGLFLTPFVALGEAVWLLLPQGVDFSRVTFLADPIARAAAESGVRSALIVSHGAGVRVALGGAFSFSIVARFCWALLAARASDEAAVVTGISGVGGEVGLALGAHF